MAVQAPKPTGNTPTVRKRWTRTGARPKPVNNFELYSWYFFRVSGVLLIFLAFGHLIIMHIINNVDVINYQFVAARWVSPLWRTYDILLLGLALIHGLNGVRVLIYDYISSRGWRVFALSALYVTGAFFIIIGAQVIITFQPQISVVTTAVSGGK